MKKKGFTMVELMVSIAIIAVVMVFLVRLLVDVKYDATNELFDTANQINRAEIIKTIEEDWKDKQIIEIIDSSSTASSLNIQLKYSNGTAKINVASSNNEDYFTYTSTTGKVTKWILEAKNSETYIQKTNVPYTIIKADNSNPQNDPNDYVLIIDIPIIIDNSPLRKEQDSKMDNIVLSFYGYGKNSINNNGTLNPEE